MTIKLYKHQKEVLEQTKEKNKVAYYLDMGLGKTFVGSEKAIELNDNILVICQKSKVEDWVEHFKTYYNRYNVYDLTKKDNFENMLGYIKNNVGLNIFVINYDLTFRRKELSKLRNFTLMLDESSLIQNETSKRSKFILKQLHPRNVILLSGTPTGGKYEKLWSQCRLLGWNITKRDFYDRYVIEEDLCNWAGIKLLTPYGTPIKTVVGYKRVKELKENLRGYGAVFMKTEDVLDLPEQVFVEKTIKAPSIYKKFKRDKMIEIDNKTLVGDTSLTQLLYERQICGMYNKDKIDYLKDLIISTEDRLIVFYNFNEELKIIEDVCLKLDRPLSIVNGYTKDLSLYDNYENSVTAIQYQAGSMGLNLQLSNKIIYFTPPLSSEIFEQSKKRIHRIGQEQTCFYYLLKTGVEEDIYETLKMRKDFTDKLFEERNRITKINFK